MVPACVCLSTAASLRNNTLLAPTNEGGGHACATSPASVEVMFRRKVQSTSCCSCLVLPCLCFILVDAVASSFHAYTGISISQFKSWRERPNLLAFVHSGCHLHADSLLQQHAWWHWRQWLQSTKTRGNRHAAREHTFGGACNCAVSDSQAATTCSSCHQCRSRSSERVLEILVRANVVVETLARKTTSQ